MPAALSKVSSIGTNLTYLIVNNIVFSNAAAGATSIGGDNSFQTGAGGLTVNGVIDDMPTGLQTLCKNNGGALCSPENTYDGGTIITQGRRSGDVARRERRAWTISLTTRRSSLGPGVPHQRCRPLFVRQSRRYRGEVLCSMRHCRRTDGTVGF